LVAVPASQRRRELKDLLQPALLHQPIPLEPVVDLEELLEVERRTHEQPDVAGLVSIVRQPVPNARRHHLRITRPEEELLASDRGRERAIEDLEPLLLDRMEVLHRDPAARFEGQDRLQEGTAGRLAGLDELDPIPLAWVLDHQPWVRHPDTSRARSSRRLRTEATLAR